MTGVVLGFPLHGFGSLPLDFDIQTDGRPLSLRASTRARARSGTHQDMDGTQGRCKWRCLRAFEPVHWFIKSLNSASRGRSAVLFMQHRLEAHARTGDEAPVPGVSEHDNENRECSRMPLPHPAWARAPIGLHAHQGRARTTSTRVRPFQAAAGDHKRFRGRSETVDRGAHQPMGLTAASKARVLSCPR